MFIFLECLCCGWLYGNIPVKGIMLFSVIFANSAVNDYLSVYL